MRSTLCWNSAHFFAPNTFLSMFFLQSYKKNDINKFQTYIHIDYIVAVVAKIIWERSPETN